MRAISNTSPLVLLHAVRRLPLLTAVFEELWIPPAVVAELAAGSEEGYPAPELDRLPGLQIVPPQHEPSEWLALDLGPGERAAMSLAIEHGDRVVLLDDALARRVASAAGLTVWGTLRVLLEAKDRGALDAISPVVDELVAAGMWLSEDLRSRVLRLAQE